MGFLDPKIWLYTFLGTIANYPLFTADYFQGLTNGLMVWTVLFSVFSTKQIFFGVLGGFFYHLTVVVSLQSKRLGGRIVPRPRGPS